MAKRINYVEVLKARAKRYHVATAAPDYKPLDHTALRNQRNIKRWREAYCKAVARGQR